MALNFTAPQKATVKAWLDANAPSMTEDEAAAVLNALAFTNYFAWLPDAKKSVVDAQIVKSSYTPSDLPPASPSTDMTYQNRALLCQLKQSNAQWLTAGDSNVVINAQLGSVRTNFKDCLMDIPSGASGASKDAGWGNPGNPGAVRLSLMRSITVLEKLFVSVAAGAGNVGGDARGLNTNPDLLGVGSNGLPLQGNISAQEVSNIIGGL